MEKGRRVNTGATLGGDELKGKEDKGERKKNSAM
jgi:hypothetical protein